MRAFEGQTVVITGGGSGVGAALALALAGAGAKIYLIGRRSYLLQLIAKKARDLGSQADYSSADISSNEGQLEAVERLKKDLTQVDILIQNAAMYARGSIEEATRFRIRQAIPDERPRSLLVDTSLVADAKITPRTSGVHQFEQRNNSKAFIGTIRCDEACPQSHRGQLASGGERTRGACS